jgi:hypothetical protein
MVPRGVGPHVVRPGPGGSVSNEGGGLSNLWQVPSCPKDASGRAHRAFVPIGPQNGRGAAGRAESAALSPVRGPDCWSADPLPPWPDGASAARDPELVDAEFQKIVDRQQAMANAETPPSHPAVSLRPTRVIAWPDHQGGALVELRPTP